MSIYVQIKNAMRNKGYAVSEGDGWSKDDERRYTEFMHMEAGIHPNKSRQGLAYPGFLADHVPGFNAEPSEADEDVKTEGVSENESETELPSTEAENETDEESTEDTQESESDSETQSESESADENEGYNADEQGA